MRKTYRPTFEQRKAIDKICNDCIQILKELPLAEQAFALSQLRSSWEDTMHGKILGWSKEEVIFEVK